MKRAIKILGIVVVVYVGLVTVFETLLGYYQPVAGTVIENALLRDQLKECHAYITLLKREPK